MTTNHASRPRTVKIAAMCLWISALLALLATAAQVAGLVPNAGASIGATAVGGLLTAALLAVIACNISEGRSWARWLFVIIYAIGTPASVVATIMAPAYFAALPSVLQANRLLQFALETAALLLVFGSRSRDWFKQPLRPESALLTDASASPLRAQHGPAEREL